MKPLTKRDRLPLWVKAFGVVSALVVIGLGAILLTTGHGPGQHDLGLNLQAPDQGSQ